MDRKKALALAAAVTGVLGSTAVAVAAVTGVSVLGLGGGPAARLSSLTSYEPGTEASTGVITRKEDVYDKIVVEGTPRAVTAAGPAGLMAAPAAPTQPAGVASPPAVGAPRPTPKRRGHHPAPNTSTTVRTVRSPQQASTPTSEPTTEPTASEPADPPATLAPTTTSTMPPVTTTTRPPGVPKDWPPGKPIPPMPPNCRHPQLEDNGVWNCGDD